MCVRVENGGKIGRVNLAVRTCIFEMILHYTTLLYIIYTICRIAYI